MIINSYIFSSARTAWQIIQSWVTGSAPTTYTAGPSHGAGVNAFYGGVLTPAGKVIFAPFRASTVGIYDPVANTYTAGPSHGAVAYAFAGGVLTPSGKVIFVPLYSSTVGIMSGGAAVASGDESALISEYLNKF